jgi:hypothetical protein
MPEQAFSGSGQEQAPFSQVEPAPQAIPQPPQLNVSVCVSTHVPLQA